MWCCVVAGYVFLWDPVALFAAVHCSSSPLVFMHLREKDCGRAFYLERNSFSSPQVPCSWFWPQQVIISYILARCCTCISHLSFQLGFGFKASCNGFKSHCGFASTLPSVCGKDHNLELFGTKMWYLSLLTSNVFLRDCLHWCFQAWQFYFLGAVSSYFLCLPGFRGCYHGSNAWCRRHPLCCFVAFCG